MKSSYRTLAAVSATTCALVALVPVTAAAAPAVAKLRVEAGGRALDLGTSYVNGTATMSTAAGQCNASGNPSTVFGPSAMGLVNYGKQVNSLLRPVLASDQFGPGSLTMCRIGDYSGPFEGSKYWFYKVNHGKPKKVVVNGQEQVVDDDTRGGDQYPLGRGDEVLWYYAAWNENQEELALRTPARVRPNQTFGVRAYAYDRDGKAIPAGGVQILGDARTVTRSDGWTFVKATRAGTFRLRAVRGNDVPAEWTRTCVNATLERCPAVRGQRIFGTTRADSISGTAGADSIKAREGNDRVYVGRGERDAVVCGAGTDYVRASRNDSVARDCERVARV